MHRYREFGLVSDADETLRRAFRDGLRRAGLSHEQFLDALAWYRDHTRPGLDEAVLKEAFAEFAAQRQWSPQLMRKRGRDLRDDPRRWRARGRRAAAFAGGRPRDGRTRRRSAAARPRELLARRRAPGCGVRGTGAPRSARWRRGYAGCSVRMPRANGFARSRRCSMTAAAPVSDGIGPMRRCARTTRRPLRRCTSMAA